MKNGHKAPIAEAQPVTGVWHAVCNHTGDSVEVPGLAREQGYEARAIGALKLTNLIGEQVKPEYVRVEWVQKDERRA